MHVRMRQELSKEKEVQFVVGLSVMPDASRIGYKGIKVIDYLLDLLTMQIIRVISYCRIQFQMSLLRPNTFPYLSITEGVQIDNKGTLNFHMI